MKLIFLLFNFLLLSACTVVHYQGIAQSADRSLNISGQEIAFMVQPKAIVLECRLDGAVDYVCYKNYPGDSVSLFANPNVMRAK